MTAITDPPAESVSEREGMPLDEFLRRQDEQPFELIEGEMVPLMTPKAFGSDYFARDLQRAIDRYGKGDTFIEATFIIPSTDQSTWVKGSRQPDVLYLAEGRLAQYRAERSDWRVKPLMLIPDLAVEVVSPTDRLPKVWRKAAIYLEDSVRLVWIINPMTERVTIFAAGEAPITLDKSGVLSGGDVLPGFTLNVRDLFVQ